LQESVFLQQCVLLQQCTKQETAYCWQDCVDEVQTLSCTEQCYTHSSAAAAAAAADSLTMQGSSAPRDGRPSIHRCLIYLGDLARYTAQAAPKATPAAAAAGPGQHPAAKQEWQRAAHYYRLAARVLPRSGNPHNQLAVMAVMTGDELRAVYHYARSLSVGIPFWTARENLLLLFEQNRARWVLPVQDPTPVAVACFLLLYWCLQQLPASAA
jgi:hypothetical protein